MASSSGSSGSMWIDQALAQALQNEEFEDINADEALAHALQNKEREEQLALDEAIARQLQEMDNIGDSIPAEPVNNNSNQEQEIEPSNENIDPDNMTYEERLDLEERIGNVSRGLSDETISRLPTSTYTKKKFNIIPFFKKTPPPVCVICHLAYQMEQKIINLACSHSFHAECITHWLKMNKTCPVCKREVAES